MSKTSNKSKESASAPGADLQIVIDKVLYDLLKAGKIQHVLTWKNLDGKKPGLISVLSTQEDEPIVCKVKQMDVVGFGYLPIGYPEAFTTDRKTTRFTVEIGNSIEAAPESTNTESDGSATGPAEQ